MSQYVVVVVAEYNMKFGVTFGVSLDALLSDSLVECIGSQPSPCHPLAPILMDWRVCPKKKKPWEIAIRLLFVDHLVASPTSTFSSRPLSLPVYLQNTLRVWKKHSRTTEDVQRPGDCQTLVNVILKEQSRLQSAMLYGLSLVHMLFQVAAAGRIFSVGFPLPDFVRLKASLLFVGLDHTNRKSTGKPVMAILPCNHGDRDADADVPGRQEEVSQTQTCMLPGPSELPFVAFAQAWSVAPGSFIRRGMATLMLLDIVREWCIATFAMFDGLLLLDSLLEKTRLWSDALTERDLFLISSVDTLANLI